MLSVDNGASTQESLRPSQHEFAFVEYIKSCFHSEHPLVRQLEELAFLTPRRPDVNDSKYVVQCPSVESMPTQLQNLVRNPETKKIDPVKKAQLLERIKQWGVVFYADGIKVQSGSAGNNAYGDLYVAHNLDILYRAARDLKCDIIFGVYSGDENAGLVLIPQETTFPDKEALQRSFGDKCRELQDATYRNPNHPQAAIFREMQKSIDEKENAHREPNQKPYQLGFTLNTKPADDIEITVNSKTGGIRLRTMIGQLLDIAQDKPVPESTATIELTDAIEIAMGNEVTSHDRRQTVLPRLPSQMQELYRQMVKEHLVIFPNDKKRKDLHPEAMPLDKVLGLLESAVFEPIFPRHLQVRRKNMLVKDIEDGRQSKKKYRLFTFANTRVKNQNEKSHLLGDHEIIATFNILQRYIQSIRGDEGTKSNLAHEGIKYYQSQGSGMLLIEDSIFAEIGDQLQDSLHINEFSLEHESSRTIKTHDNQAYRANPFIVSTLVDYPIDEKFEIDKFWQHMDKDARSIQEFNEFATTVYVSGLLNAYSTELIDTLNKLLKPNSKSEEYFRNLQQNFRFYEFIAQLAHDFIHIRHQRAELARKWLNGSYDQDLAKLLQPRQTNEYAPTAPGVH